MAGRLLAALRCAALSGGGRAARQAAAWIAGRLAGPWPACDRPAHARGSQGGGGWRGTGTWKCLPVGPRSPDVRPLSGWSGSGTRCQRAGGGAPSQFLWPAKTWGAGCPKLATQSSWAAPERWRTPGDRLHACPAPRCSLTRAGRSCPAERGGTALPVPGRGCRCPWPGQIPPAAPPDRPPAEARELAPRGGA